MSLSATTTSRMRRQQRLQQSRTPTKQRLHNNPTKQMQQQPQHPYQEQRSRSHHVPSPAAILIPEHTTTASNNNAAAPVVTPPSRVDSPYGHRNKNNHRPRAELVSPTRLQYNNNSYNNNNNTNNNNNDLVGSSSSSLSPSPAAKARARTGSRGGQFSQSSPPSYQFDAALVSVNSASMPMPGNNNNNYNRAHKRSSSLTDYSIAVSNGSNNGEEMPMDEMYATLNNSKRRPSASESASASASATASATASAAQHSDEVSSLGGGVEDPVSLRRLANAIKNGLQDRPHNLSQDERALWDVVQVAMVESKKEQTQKRRHIEKQFQEMASKYDRVRHRERQLQKQLEANKKKLQAQNGQQSDEDNTSDQHQQEKDENDRAFRAIQRVLADVTTERDTLVEKLTNDLHSMVRESEATTQQLNDLKIVRDEISQENRRLKEELDTLKQNVPSMLDKTMEPNNENDANIQDLKQALQQAEKEKAAMKRELEAKSSRMVSAERALKISKVALKKHEKKDLEEHSKKDEEATNLASELEEAKKEIASLKQKKRDLATDLETKTKQLKDQSEKMGETNAERELLTVQKKLEEKSSSLENAKMIIASLENAQGSLAVDLRSKLKEKEDELTALQTTTDDRKRMLDSIATELRELQLKQGDVELTEKKNKELCTRHRSLATVLERNVKALRSAAVMHEAMGDANSVDKISAIVSETFTALKHSVETSEDLLSGVADDYGDAKDVGVQSEGVFDDNGDTVKELMLELANKKKLVNQLEETLQHRENESNDLRSDMDRMKLESKEQSAKMQNEIQSLRDQCKTNMEVLTKKSKELEVLRGSLEVEDGVGYISDDDEDEDEEDNHAETDHRRDSISSPTQLGSSQQYDQSQAEAIATLLSHSGSGIEVGLQSAVSEEEVNSLRNELVKAQNEKEDRDKKLKAEQESLANAKMIISSLEKANKSMMEDLRSRLQDSNTAIASLLEKSMEHEQTSANLRSEVERLKKERDEEVQKAKIEQSKLRDENMVFKMKVESKDLEMEELRANISSYVGGPVAVSPTSSSSGGGRGPIGGSVEEKKEDSATPSILPGGESSR